MNIPTQEDDGLKWFGEGFDGFPKRLPDDCVEYIIHVIDAKQQSVAAPRTRLNQILKASNELKKKLLKDYIWQREPFDFRIHPQPSSQNVDTAKQPSEAELTTRPHLKGRTNFGDSVADEWLIVYLLLELSKQFSDAWIRIYDTDGEFLLIEAANALPKWLNPDIAENRVWISNGHLRIIPLDEGQATSRNVDLHAALRFIEDQPEELIISPFIEDEAFYRLRDYPAAIASSLHHSLATIPRTLAYVLHRNPVYISPAIESFYLRDPVALRPLATKDLSTLHFPPEDFITVFDPPPAWTGVLPRMKDPKAEMGMKLTCGFEMLVSDPQNADKREVREIRLLLDDVESGEEKLPTDDEVAAWSQRQDEEKWLDIDYRDFEDELSGKRPKANGKDGAKADRGDGFGDAAAQENLRKMVSRFEDFLNDDAAGADGVDSDDDDDDDDDDASTSSSGEDRDASFSEAEFEKAMKEMMGMPPEDIEKNGLLDEARKLAIEDAEGEEEDVDGENEDEEMKKVMEIMEKELKGHGALDLSGGDVKVRKNGGATAPVKEKKPVFFGPERPPAAAKRRGSVESADEEIGPGDGELSSDDEEEFNDVDLGLAKNMLESFKGQAGMAGPAGNLMRNLGVNMPRDEGGESD
ncbi:hypothetical protein LTR37_003600 [Vermiconidia calcicola]|uniref:Uncharacterized protein n=1 Tax=Vermiconidia calcicola TaxID=1690605 RepID=A0ACC3NPF3_9PEZI|nr:hypothetical protein LTR37_003600 [Vermiconidia calcicola]